MKKLAGRTDVEDALDRLDRLMQEESLMAAAQGLKATGDVDHKVQGVDDTVRDIHDKMDVIIDGMNLFSFTHRYDPKFCIWLGGEKVRETVQQAANDHKRSSSHCLGFIGQGVSISITLTGHQLRKDFEAWLCPPDPSVNYNIASNAHHEGTAQWFIESSEFKKWKESEALLWIHGKRMSPALYLLNPSKQRPFHSRIREKCS